MPLNYRNTNFDVPIAFYYVLMYCPFLKSINLTCYLAESSAYLSYMFLSPLPLPSVDVVFLIAGNPYFNLKLVIEVSTFMGINLRQRHWFLRN